MKVVIDGAEYIRRDQAAAEGGASEAVVLAWLEAAIAVHGGVRAAAERWGVSPALVSDTRNGRRRLGKKMLDALGFEARKAVVYVRKDRPAAEGDAS